MFDTQTLCFFALSMSFISLWIRKTAWLWASFLAISLILAIQAGVAKPFSLVPIGILLVSHFLLEKNIGGKERIILVLLATFVSAGLILGLFPWFCDWQITEKFWIHYGKPFIGLFVLAFPLPLLRSKEQWVSISLKTIPLTILGIAALAFLATSGGEVGFCPKWPSYFLLRSLVNLIFVTIPEEAFFRGFLQEEISRFLGKGFWKSTGAVLISSALFMVAHIGWTSSPAMLGFVFIAGLLYGGIYQYTKAIEGSIFCHLALNVTHMVFFTYHAM